MDETQDELGVVFGISHFFLPNPIKNKMMVMTMAKIGRKMPILELQTASKITPAHTAKIAMTTNMYFMAN